MSENMRAAVYIEPGKIENREIPKPKVNGGEVLIKVARGGICGSDLHIFDGKHPRAKPPLVMCHEFVGTVEEIGQPNIKNLKTGERVVANPLLWCGKCLPCLMGYQHVCHSLNLVGIDRDGGFAEYVVVSADRVHRISPEIPFEEAALAEPLAVALHAVRSSNLCVGQNVVVVGAGTIGMLVGIVALFSGAQKVWILDINTWRLEHAKPFGLTPINVQENDPLYIVKKETNDARCDVVFECSGSNVAYSTITSLAATRGEVVFVGIPTQNVPIDICDSIFREIHTTSVRVYTNEEFGISANLLSENKINLRSLVTCCLPLNKLSEGMKIANNREGWKVLLNPEMG